MQILTAEEYIDKFNETIADLEWPQDALSDHLPVFAGQFATWNLLNPIWLQWQQKEDPNGQRLDKHWLAQNENQEKRLKLQYQFILSTMPDFFCLQEVGVEFLKLLSDDIFGTTGIKYVKTPTNDRGDNFNLILYKSKYTLLSSEIIKELDDKFQGSNIYYTFRGEYTFNIMSVHLEFGTNQEFANIIKNMNEKIYIMGDFNASMRKPKVGPADNMICYSDHRFTFCVDELKFNHLNLYGNTIDDKVPGFKDGDAHQMFDKFDHIMIFKPLYKI